MIVYALLDPRDGAMRYVGKTHRTARRRLRRHLAPCYLKGQTHKERWIRSLLRAGVEPGITILETCETASATATAERAHIARLRSAGARLTNVTPGGDGGGGPHSEASREKIRRALLGKPKSEEHRRRSGLATRGRKASEATRALLRACRGGPRRPLTAEHRVSVSRAKGGRPFVDQHGNRYETQKGAARHLAVNVGHLNEVLHGKRGHVHGYRFRFIADAEFPA